MNHDASNCDAFPLAVGLAQAKARIERIEAIAERMADVPKCYAGADTDARDALAAYTAHQIDG